MGLTRLWGSTGCTSRIYAKRQVVVAFTFCVAMTWDALASSAVAVEFRSLTETVRIISAWGTDPFGTQGKSVRETVIVFCTCFSLASAIFAPKSVSEERTFGVFGTWGTEAAGTGGQGVHGTVRVGCTWGSFADSELTVDIWGMGFTL